MTKNYLKLKMQIHLQNTNLFISIKKIPPAIQNKSGRPN